MERGEVYYLRYDDGFGHEQAVGRPVVVISSQKGINKSATILVAFLSTKYNQCNLNVELRHMPRRSFVLCNQLQTVDRERLSENVMYKLTKREMEEVDGRICEALGIESTVKEIEVVKEVEIEKTVVVDDAEKTRLQIELDLYKKLYSDLTKQIVDARFERQVVVEEKPVVVSEVVEETVVEKPKATEYIIVDDLVEEPKVDLEKLKKLMSTPNDEMVEEEPVKPKKMGRPKGSKNKPSKANINKDDWETIAAVTGMSPQTAQEIVAWRKKHGDFIDLSDLLFVRRFGKGCMTKYGQMLEA